MQGQEIKNEEHEFKNEEHGSMFAGRGVVRKCPECFSASNDQMWLEVRNKKSKVGVAWCPCGCVFTYNLNTRYDADAKKDIEFVGLDVVLRGAG